MKAITAALFLLAVLAMAEARPTMRVLNKKTTTATASSAAYATDGGTATSGATADAKNGGNADANSVAYAAGPGADADSYAGAYADDWGTANADSKAVAVGEDAYAGSAAGAYASGEATADADSKAVAVGEDAYASSVAGAYASGDADADASSSAYAYGGSTAKSSAYATAKADPKHYYYGYYGYYPEDDGEDDGYGYVYDPHHYYYKSYYGYKAVDPSKKYPVHSHYVVVKPAEEKEYTVVKHVDPAILAYYEKHVYDYGCYEGKYYRCVYDDSCGECPYGYFCGEKTEKVCEDVEVWVKNCDPAAAAKKCVPDLTACGTGFCKFNEKCAADYYWCGAKWCTPKYACVAVEAPKKCIWELKDGKKVQTCTEYAPEQCGKEACAIGYKCSEDPCTFEKKTVQKCEDKSVPVCVAYDIPSYKTLFSKCGPGYCHPGYKCEAFDHDSCVVKVEVKPVYVGYKPEDPVYVHHEHHKHYDHYDHYEHSDDEDDGHDKHAYVPHYYHEDDKDSSASVTATAKSVATDEGVYSYTNVDASATGDGVATGSAGAAAYNDDSAAASYSGATASGPDTSAGTYTGAYGEDAVAAGDASADYSSDK